jgi:DNA-3-methyladenine glycosylase II
MDGRKMAKARQSQVIETLDDIEAGMRALKRKCPHMQRAAELAGVPPLRRNAGGFEGLARIVVGQQVSVAAANAIWARVLAGVQPLTPERMAALSEAELRACGLSRPKIVTLTKAAAHLVEAGDWLPELAAASDDEVRARLTALPGIGPWTSDIYLMFCLGRADSFPSGDLALQLAAQRLMGLAARPAADELAEIAAARWRPWRGVAARMLWAYYAFEKRTATGTAEPV